MSDTSGTLRAQSKIANPRHNALRRRLPLYAGIAALVVLTLAYVDGGEEPLHPIVHNIAPPVAQGSSQ